LFFGYKLEALYFSPRHRVGPERMQKPYFRKWSFDNRELAGMRFGETEARSLFSFPLFIFRCLFRDASQWIKTVFQERDEAFYIETSIWYNLGFILGRMKRRWSQVDQ